MCTHRGGMDKLSNGAFQKGGISGIKGMYPCQHETGKREL